MIRAAIPLAAAVLLAGCGYSVSKAVTWSEEVELAEGHTIEVDRKTESTLSDSASADGETTSGSWSSVIFPSGTQVPEWKESLRPLLVFQDPATHEWVIVARSSDCTSDSAFQEYRLADGGWRRGDLSDAAIGRESNLWLDIDGELPKSPISTAVKRKARKVTIRRDDRGSCS